MDWSFEHEMIVRRSGAGPALVWIHGLGEWSASFDPVARHPALAAFSHVLVDLPGYGRSPWPRPAESPPDRGSPQPRSGESPPDRGSPWPRSGESPPAVGRPARSDVASTAPSSLDHLADGLAAWLRERPPAVVIGHSMGGVLATLLGERIALRGIVNLEGNLSLGDCTFSARANAYGPDDFSSHGFAALQAEAFALGATDIPLRGYHAALCAASPAVFHRNATDLVALSVTETLAPRLAALRCPSLYIAGVPRGICTHSHALLDHHRIRWLAIQPAGHWVFVDQPTAVADAIAAFVREL